MIAEKRLRAFRMPTEALHCELMVISVTRTNCRSESLGYYTASVRGGEGTAPALDSSLSRRSLGPIVSQSVAETPVEVLEREVGVRLPRQHEQRIGVLLGTALGAFARIFRYEHDRTHEFVLPLFVCFERRREKRGVGVTVFVAQAWRWGPDVRGDSLCLHADPVAAGVSVTAAGKL